MIKYENKVAGTHSMYIPYQLTQSHPCKSHHFLLQWSNETVTAFYGNKTNISLITLMVTTFTEL